MSAMDNRPQWIKVSTSDMTSPEGRYILGGKSVKEWCDYGRYMGLQQLIACSPKGYIDTNDPRRLRSLAHDLGMTPKACRDWLDMLALGGALIAEDYKRGAVVTYDSAVAVQEYARKSRANRENGKGGGRPRKKRDETNTDAETDAKEETET